MNEVSWIDFLAGERLARAAASVVFIFLFAAKWWRFAYGSIRGRRVSLEERFAFGVGSIAAATLIYNASGLVQNFMGRDTPFVALFVIADGLMLFGYYQALVALRGAHLGKLNGSIWVVAACLFFIFLVGMSSSVAFHWQP